ncbi:MAG: SLBB domain-containing protein [Alistipes sp.]|nr:SLBB domain-containing protein [Alistipes senegalensis]MCM1250981.1 SLBB domain-containing protein [Alistipes sp.]
MNHKFLILFFAMCFLAGGAQAQMTDEQIVEYVQQGITAGKNEQQLARELLIRGVSQSQLLQLKSRYEAGGLDGMLGSSSLSGAASAGSRSAAGLQRGDVFRNVSDEEPETVMSARMGGNAMQGMTGQMPGMTMNAMSGQTGLADPSLSGAYGVDPYGEYGYYLNARDTVGRRRVFGRSFFSGRTLTFEPNGNMATPQDYRLGPGDEVIIDIWGANEDNIQEYISPEGNIMVEEIGPVYLSGLTVREAGDRIRNLFARKYAGVSGEEPESQVRVSLGQIRTILINVMGEVEVPGTYRLSAFSTVFHALYRAGGVTDIGTLRSVEVLRGGRRIAELDLYDFIFSGKFGQEVRLEEGDIVLVRPYEKMVEAKGKFRRPMFYELRQGETLQHLFDYAAGFAGDAYNKEVRVVRRSGRDHELFSVPVEHFASFELKDGDRIEADSVLSRYANRVEVRGSVYRPGFYELGDDVHTVGQLIARAEGLKEDAFLARALLYRECDDLLLRMVAVDLAGIVRGTTPDVELKCNDVLVIPSRHELTELGGFTISGQVANPGTYPYVEDMTLEDLILQAGGLLDGASTVRVEVARRLKDAESTDNTNDLGEVFTFSLKNGFVVDGKPGFRLKPFDVVAVRKSPAYQEQRLVTVDGEVLFSGEYALLHKNERISDLVIRAGGVTNDAYIRGSRLTRRMNEEEKALRDDVLRMAKLDSGADSLNVEKLQESDTYTVGIELEKALENPGSDYDVVLREGDRLFVPEYVSTVKIMGEVMRPNTVLYSKNMKYKDYIDQAGGYASRAKKSRTYIVYMNGMISRKKNRIEPGCEIIVPRKRERAGLGVTQIMGLATSAASLGTMAATIANLSK